MIRREERWDERRRQRGLPISLRRKRIAPRVRRRSLMSAYRRLRTFRFGQQDVVLRNRLSILKRRHSARRSRPRRTEVIRARTSPGCILEAQTRPNTSSITRHRDLQRARSPVQTISGDDERMHPRDDTILEGDGPEDIARVEVEA